MVFLGSIYHTSFTKYEFMFLYGNQHQFCPPSWIVRSLRLQTGRVHHGMPKVLVWSLVAGRYLTVTHLVQEWRGRMWSSWGLYRTVCRSKQLPSWGVWLCLFTKNNTHSACWVFTSPHWRAGTVMRPWSECPANSCAQLCLNCMWPQGGCARFYVNFNTS